MEKLELKDNWSMRRTGEENWREARVWGSVYTDLLRNGEIPDPYWKDNEDQICALMEADYEYQCRFTAEDPESYARVFLSFEGLDTVADIWLNGTYLGHAENMHRTWDYEVKEYLKKDNVLQVIFRSPLKFIARAYEKYKNIGNDDTYEGFMHLRKAHYMFGWDWGAHLPDAGIFRPVYLCYVKNASLENVYIRQRQEKDDWMLDFEIRKKEEKKGDYQIQVSALSPQGKALETWLSPDGTGTLRIPDPQLWWVNGLGDQPLYQIRAVLYRNGEPEDCWERRIGLRKMTVRREKDQWGESFAHEINGIPFFAMGADYIPEEHLLGKRSREKTRQLLEDCKRANFNVIRVWGGGFYPDDWFYDLCDELGLAVWQDFMFACSVYELTPEFEENIRRIRHHACLALWCGNNEMEMFVDERCWVTKHSEVRDYLFMYERIFPEILGKEDPETFYWPASPSSGGSFDNPNDPDRGDVHYWKVWHGGRPFSEYRKFFFRYISEFGFQALPSQKTIETFTDDPRDWNLFSYIMEKHQRNYGANGKIMNYMQQTYRYPGGFSDVIYASQLLQADAIRYGVEHFRRNRGRCMGAVYWQVRNAKARILYSKEKEILVPPLSSVWLEKEELPDIHVFEEYVSYQAWEGETQISEGTVIFSYPKYFRYEDPKLSCTVEKNKITVKAETYAKSVEILNDQEDLVLSDNYFDLNGDTKTVEILRGRPEGIRLRSVWNIGEPLPVNGKNRL